MFIIRVIYKGEISMLKKYFNGLKFGLLLQIAVGPMCLMVFNTAKNVGLLVAMSLVLAIALVDAFYITLASIGVSKLLEKKELVVFSIGLVSATLFFLTSVAILGTVLSNFIPEKISNILNIIVGVLIIYFGIKLLIKKEK